MMIELTTRSEYIADIIIPHHDRDDLLRQCLKNINNKTFNIIVSADGSFAENCNSGVKKTILNNYVLFQINHSLMNTCSTEQIAHILNNIIDKYKCNVCLFVAGSANLHDNIKQYEDIKNFLYKQYSQENVYIIKEKDPLKLVDWIGYSKMWIGSSLHGRIVSSAYEIPRISLQTEKVTNYCQLWDSEFPFDVLVDNLLEACAEALSVDEGYISRQAKLLSEKANKNLHQIINEIYV